MTILSCAAVQRRLAAFHDGELSIADQIAVEAHVESCPPCASELAALRRVGEVLREGTSARLMPADVAPGLEATIISRLSAERAQSWPMVVRGLFEDMHLVWAALSATAATAACAVLVFALWYFSPPERSDSLAGVLGAMSAPGSNRNPVSIDGRIILPRIAPGAPVPAVFGPGTPREEDLVFALAAVVTQEGRIAHAEVLGGRHDRATVTRLMNAVVEARFQPASYDGSPVAVNLVWLLTHTTVRGKTHS